MSPQETLDKLVDELNKGYPGLGELLRIRVMEQNGAGEKFVNPRGITAVSKLFLWARTSEGEPFWSAVRDVTAIYRDSSTVSRDSKFRSSLCYLVNRNKMTTQLAKLHAESQEKETNETLLL